MTVQVAETIPIMGAGKLEESPRRKSDMTFNELRESALVGKKL
jgi:hypothetical protein